MDEDFGLHSRDSGAVFDLGEAELAGQDHAGEAELGRGADVGVAHGAGLCAEVELELGEGGLEGQEAGVADEDGVGFGVSGQLEGAGGFAQFSLGEVDVEGEIGSGAFGVGRCYGSGELFGAKVAGPAAGVEAFEAEVDGVRAGFESGLEAGGVSGWGEEFHGFLSERF